MLHGSLLVSVNVSMVTLQFRSPPVPAPPRCPGRSGEEPDRQGHQHRIAERSRVLLQIRPRVRSARNVPSRARRFRSLTGRRRWKLMLQLVQQEADQAGPQGSLGGIPRPCRTATSASSSRPRTRSKRAWSRRVSTARRSSTGRSGSACATSRACSSGIRASSRCLTRGPSFRDMEDSVMPTEIAA